MKLAIKGHLERGKEVIKILEMLGGINSHNLYGDESSAYYTIDSDKEIKGGIYVFGDEQLCYFTLEQFEEKFPYKVGDKVKTIYGKIGIINKPIWSDRDNCIRYELKADTDSFYFVNELQPYKEEIVDTGCCSMPTIPPSYKLSIKQLEEMKQTIVFSNDSPDEIELVLGDNYEVKVKEGKTYVVKKKPKYPKTYEECYNILSEFNFTKPEKYDFEFDWRCTIKNKYYGKLMQSFVKLLICRDVYWKIAGEQMGLGKDWKPDWNNGYVEKYYIYLKQNEIEKSSRFFEHHFLAFPTKEMRDAFYENFKESIQNCKELL